MEKNIRKLLMIGFVIFIAFGLRFAVEIGYNFIAELFSFSPMIGFASRTLFMVVLAIIWLSITLRSEFPHTKLPWLLILTFEPIVGITLFLTFGRNFKHSRRYKKRPHMHDANYITREKQPHDETYQFEGYTERLQEIFHTAHHLSHHQAFLNSNGVEIFRNGETFYPELKQAIDNASSFILFEFFILRSDTRGCEIVDLLIKKAESGVKVKMIIDGLGSARLSHKVRKRIKTSPIDFVVNDRIYFPLFNSRINYRNHRKIVVIDGLVGYTGGMNVADEYDNSIEHEYYFRDTQIKIEGSAVKSLTALFFKDYYYNTNTFIDDDFYYPAHKVQSKGLMQILQSGPDSSEAHIRNVYLKMILAAKTSIKIITPYMALDQETLTALKIAGLSGVDVDIIIPGIPDKYLVYKVTKAFVSSLLDGNVKVYQYTKGFSHAKVMIIDDELASVGSYNLDNRSAIIDFEVTALFIHKEVDTLVKQFHDDIASSVLIDKVAWQKRNVLVRLFEGLVSIFSPII